MQSRKAQVEDEWFDFNKLKKNPFVLMLDLIQFVWLYRIRKCNVTLVEKLDDSHFDIDRCVE